MDRFYRFRWLLLVSILGFLSCQPNEGFGGKSKIRGKIILHEYNNDFSTLINKRPAAKHDVFIAFGNNDFYDDDLETSYDGSFEFPFLQEGKYTIFYYSLDTVSKTKVLVAKKIECNISGDETIDLGELALYSTIKYDDGYSTIKGKLVLYEYNDDFSILINKRPAAKEDLFMAFGNNKFYDDDIETSYDGGFEFSSLIAGKYSVFYYSRDTASTSEALITKKYDCSVGDKAVFDFGELPVFKTLDFDEGSAIIKGRIRQVNYRATSQWPHLIVKDTSLVFEKEIYLTYNNHTFSDARIRTQYDGTFRFENLLVGKHKIYLYYEDVTGPSQDKVKLVEVEIKNKLDIIDLGDIFIEKH